MYQEPELSVNRIRSKRIVRVMSARSLLGAQNQEFSGDYVRAISVRGQKLRGLSEVVRFPHECRDLDFDSIWPNPRLTTGLEHIPERFGLTVLNRRGRRAKFVAGEDRRRKLDRTYVAINTRQYSLQKGLEAWMKIHNPGSCFEFYGTYTAVSS